jgi:ATP-dependent helicase HrpB
MQPLPIDALLPEVVASLRRTPALVIEAPPGAGKTTRVPVALLDAGLAGEREVWVLEPRRLAARMAARRVAEERGERPGETVGYQVRFDEVASERTRLRFVTEGVLTRRLLSDPQLERVGAVVLDEFHERHLQADLALALLRRLQRDTRRDLRLVAMSATLDAAPVARYLDDCPVLRSEGRRFEVEVEHLARLDERPLASQVEQAVRRLVKEGATGDVLVFLPGAAEIRRAREACAQLAEEFDLLLLPLHGELSAEEQDRAVRPADRRKVILSTNVAETSVTIEGVGAVVDSGLARVAGHSPWSGLPVLQVARTSRASAAQRAGRAGRTRAGRCLRLYTAQDFNARPDYEQPEVARLDLAETALELHASGVRDLASFEWFEAPPAAALEAAETLLRKLDAVTEEGEMTGTGRRMLRWPLHPRLARLVVEAERRGVAREACLIAALISERDIRAGRVSLETSAAHVHERTAVSVGASDLLELSDLFKEAARARFAHERLRARGLDASAVHRVERVRRSLVRAVRGGTRAEAETEDAFSHEREAELLLCVLAGYPDRVARRRDGATDASAPVELLLAGGGAATLAPESVVRRAQFLVAVDAEVRRVAGGQQGRGARSATVVRLASAVEPDWLLDLFIDRIAETTEAQWNASAERVETVKRMTYEGLVLDETRASDAVGEEVTRLLAEKAREAGLAAFADADAIERFLARVEFAAHTYVEAGFPALEEQDALDALARLCEGRRSFAELREAVRGGGLQDALRRELTPEQSRLLASAAPERVTLARGRQVKVNYERGKPPWVASRLQDFFGMKESPKIASGRAALVLHLLAPNQRPVQLTSDLAGFWERHYPQVRRELSRRYPRHAWPDDPLKPEGS